MELDCKIPSNRVNFGILRLRSAGTQHWPRAAQCCIKACKDPFHWSWRRTRPLARMADTDTDLATTRHHPWHADIAWIEGCLSPRWVRRAITGSSGELAIRTSKHLRSVREGGALVVVDQQRGYSVEQRARAAARRIRKDGSQARLRLKSSLFY